MKLRPTTYPHGVIIENGEVYALFKTLMVFRIEKASDIRSLNIGTLRDESPELKKINSILSKVREGLDNHNLRGSIKLYDKSLKSIDLEFNNLKVKAVNTNIESPSFDVPSTISSSSLSQTNFSHVTSDTDDKSKIYDINENEYDEILNKASKFAKGEKENYVDSKIVDLFSFYSRLLEEPVLAEAKGLIKSYTIPLKEIMDRNGEAVYYDLDGIGHNKLPFKFARIDGKYYNGLAREILISNGADKDFEKVTVTFYDKYKKLLNTKAPENDGFYINVNYKKDGSGESIDPFKDHDSFAFNVLVRKDIKVKEDEYLEGKYESISLVEKKYYNKRKKAIAVDRSSGYFLPNTTLQTKSENVNTNEGSVEYRPELLFAWKGENTALNRLVKSRLIEPEDELDEGTGIRLNDNDVLYKLIKENFIVEESYIKGTNLQLESGEDFRYSFYLRTVTPFNYYLETEKEWKLRNPDVSDHKSILFFEDWLKEFGEDKAKFNPEPLAFPRFKLDAPVVVSREIFDNENSEYVDSKNNMVVNLLGKEDCEKRYLYPPRITWERFKLLSFLSKENILSKSGDNVDDAHINQYVRRCMRLEKRSLKKVRDNQGSTKRINYLADPRAKQVELIPNDLFTAQYFSDINLKEADLTKGVFNLKPTFPYFDSAKGVNIEAVNVRGTNKLTIDEKTFLNNIPNGAYSLKIHLDHIDNSDLKEKNGQHLDFSFIDIPKPPKTNEKLQSERLVESSETDKANQNNWKLSYKLDSSWNKEFSRKSIKFYEQTDILSLQHENLNELVENFDRNLDDFNLLDGEYPVDLFITQEGNLTENLQANSYPEKLTLNLNLEDDLCIGNQLILKLRLSQEDELSVLADESKGNFALWMNGELAEIFNTGRKFEVSYSDDREKFLLSSGDDFECELTQKVNPELSVRDIEVSEKMILKKSQLIDGKPVISKIEVNGKEYLSQSYETNIIKLTREQNEIIVKDEGHPYYRDKTIKLFASSAFQGYFPNYPKKKQIQERDIGASGEQKIKFKVVNNTDVEIPEFDTDILIYKHQEKSWGKNNQISEERSFLVRILLDQSFMREGTPNKFAIVLGRYKDSTCSELIEQDTEDISVIGEDITRMINPAALVSNDIDRFLDKATARQELQKYFANKAIDSNNSVIDKLLKPGVKNIKIGGYFYKVMICQPYYNVGLKKWQVVLSFKDPNCDNPKLSVEAIFVRLIGFKIAFGREVVQINPSNNCYEFTEDTSKVKTVISSFAKPQIVPVHNKTKFILKRKPGKLEVVNKNYREGERKLCLVSKLRSRTKGNLFTNNLIFAEYQTFESSSSLVFDNNNYKEIIILEFEKHDNCQEINKIESLPIKGLRLINYVQFKI